MINRRSFITGIGVTVLAAPLAAGYRQCRLRS